MHKFTRVGALGVALSIFAAGCATSGTSGESAWGEGYRGLRVTATVPPIVDLVQRVAGDNATVVGLVPSGVDSHTFEPRPEDARVLAQTELLFVPAGQATPGVTSLANENLTQSARMVDLVAAIPPGEFIYNDSPEQVAAHGHGHDVNVHAWTNPRYAALFTRLIALELSEADPDNKAAYEANAGELIAELAELHEATEEALETIPAANRRLVVYHDSWDYFARDYGLEVVGTIQAADLAEPSVAEVGAMVRQIEEAEVPAFFGSEVFPSDVLEALSDETGAEYVGDLSDDRLPGEPGDPEHSYIGMMVANVRLMVEALGGDASALDDLSASRA